MRVAIAICVFLATAGGAAAAEPEDLIAAIRSDNLGAVEAALGAGADPNAPASDSGLPPLLEAVRADDREILKALLDAGADIETVYRNDRGEIHTAYSYAALHRKNRAGRQLKTSGASSARLACTPKYCGNAATMAALSGNYELIGYTLSVPDPALVFNLTGIESDGPDLRGRPLLPPLHAAVVTESRNGKVLRKLFWMGADVNQRDHAGRLAVDYIPEGLRPFFEPMFNQQRLIAAVTSADAEQVAQLLADGVDVNASGADGRTPLWVAVQSRHAAMVRQLLDAGADLAPVATYGGNRELTAAAEAGNVEIVRVFADMAPVDQRAGIIGLMAAAGSGNADIVLAALEAGTDPEARFDSGGLHDPDGPQPIHVAIQNGHVEIVWLLADAGADINASYRDEASEVQTALGDAIAHGHTEIALALIEKGADTTRDYSRFESWIGSYLSLAALKGNEALVRRLIEAGNEVSPELTLRSREVYASVTPLIAAVWGNHPDIVALLLQEGAEVSTKNNYGCSAYDFALINAYEEAAKLLREAGSVADEKSCDMYRYR